MDKAHEILEAARARRSEGQATWRAVLEARLAAVERDLAKVQQQNWAILVVVVGAVVGQVVLQLFKR